MMKRSLWAIALVALAITACNRSDAEIVSPTEVAYDTTTPMRVVDTTPKDTVVLVRPQRFPTVDSLYCTFVSVSAPTLTRSAKISYKDSVARILLDTGAGRVWRLAVQGRKNGRLWWRADSIRVVPDSARRIVLDSAWRRLVVADTTTPVVVVPVDTSLYIPASALAGDAYPVAGGERGLFLRYDAGVLSLILVSDGNVQGTTYDRVTNARFAMGFSESGTVDSVHWSDPTYNGYRDNDSLSSLYWTVDSTGRVSGLAGNLFSRFLPKVLAVPVSRCTVDVAVAFRSGIQGGSAWSTTAVPADSSLPLLFLGKNRTHPSKTHFKIVIP